MFGKYQYVYEIYKEKSFTKAAQKLFISQPSLSAAIKNIEKNLGAKLFDRIGHKVELTQVGKEYVLACERIIETENEFKNKLSDIYNLDYGNIVVGGANYVSSYVLPKVINDFSKRYPKISISLVEANSLNLSKMLFNGEIDLLVDSTDETENMHKYPLLKEKILLCVPKENKINIGLEKYQIHPDEIRNKEKDLTKVEPVSIKLFKNERFVLLKNGNDMYMRAMKIFEKKSIIPDVAFFVDQLNISYALSDSNIGLCFITDTFFKYGRFHENVVLYNVEEDKEGRTLYISHKENKYCTNAMQKFIECAKNVIV